MTDWYQDNFERWWLRLPYENIVALVESKSQGRFGPCRVVTIIGYTAKVRRNNAYIKANGVFDPLFDSLEEAMNSVYSRLAASK